MKFCFIIGYYPHFVGGAEYQARILADSLRYKGHEIFFISYGYEENTLGEDEGYLIYNLKTSNSLCYLPVLFKVKNILKKEKPDIVYHRAFVPYSLYLSISAKFLSIPFFFHIADEYSIQFANNITAHIKKCMLRIIVRCGSNFILQTEKQSELLSDFDIENIRVIPNLHEKNIESPRVKAVVNVVWIAKSTPVKQLEKFLDLAEKFKNTGHQFVIIGRYLNDTYSEDLLRRIDKLDNVINLGPQSNDFINEYLQHEAFLLVNTSISEGISNTFIQAWMRGVPVISLNSNPNNLFLQSNLGVYCEGDEFLMKESIERFVNNSVHYLKCSHDCYELANDYFSIERNLSKFEEYFFEQ